MPDRITGEALVQKIMDLNVTLINFPDCEESHGSRQDFAVLLR